jgi:hypothetical protein
MIVIVLGAVAAAGLYFSGTLSCLLGGSNPVLMVEAASTNIDLSAGTGTVYLTLKNSGSGTLQLSKIEINGKVSFNITAADSLPHLKWNGHDVTGSVESKSSGMAGVSGTNILVPSNAFVTLKFIFTSQDKLTDIMDIGASYSGVAFPVTGNPIQFRFLLPSW